MKDHIKRQQEVAKFDIYKNIDIKSTSITSRAKFIYKFGVACFSSHSCNSLKSGYVVKSS